MGGSKGDSRVVTLATARRSAIRQELLQRYPALAVRTPAKFDQDSIVVGRNQVGEAVSITARARLEHMHLVGATGAGKTRFIQHCACQDVIAGRGVCVIDPHANHDGSLYRNMLGWLDARGFTKTRTIHLIDPNAPTHITGFNPLALPSPEYEPTVIAEAMQEALEKLWSEEDQNTKPTMQRVLSTVLTALTELGLTLAEARLLFDPSDRYGIRAWAIETLKNEEAREELMWLHAIASEPRGHQDFRGEVTGPRNRLAKLTNNEAIKLTVSQDARNIDFRAALDEGHIILANLSPGPRAGDKATQLLGRLLTRLIFFHTVRRQQPDRAFFFYIDECHQFLSGDVSRMLAETRKYGTGLVLSHQTLAQFRTASIDMLDAVKNTTNIKVVFRVKDPEEAAELADMVAHYDLETPVRSLVKPTLVGHRLMRLKGESESEQFATSEMRSETIGTSTTRSAAHTRSEGGTLSESVGVADSEMSGWSDAISSSETQSTATGNSMTMQFGLDNPVAPSAAATGNSAGGSIGTQSNMSGGSTNHFLLGDTKDAPVAFTGLSLGESSQTSAGRTHGSQSGRNGSTGRTTSKQSGRSRSTSDAWTEGVAHARSESTSIGTSHTQGTGRSVGWSEALEPILENRPTSVHSLENLRYLASSALRNFTAGNAAISFVDAEGMKTATLRVARVDENALSEEEFNALRTRVLEASPSATPIGAARAALTARFQALVEQADLAQQPEPDTAAGFRTKRKRSSKAEPSVEVHGKPSTPEQSPVKGLDRRRRRP